jgi:predicted GNAT family N-acyltransferase
MKIEPKQRDFSEAENQAIHEIIFPADVRENDLISARVRKSDGQDFHSYRVWKLSPLGLELLNSEEQQFDTGEVVEVELKVGRNNSRFEGLIVQPGIPGDLRRTLGIRFADRKSDSITETDRRRGSRWVCSSQFDPICIAPNPAQFNDFLYFKIRDISSSGIRAITSLRNKFIVPGMELTLQISFPMTSQIAVTMKVSRLRLTAEGGKDFLEVVLAFTTLSKQQRETIGQYLVQFSDAESLEAIRSDGFFPLSLTKGVDYQFIKSEKDFWSVLELRLRANRETGKIPLSYTAADMADIYDTRGRIIVGRYRGSIIGTIRLTFFEAGEKLEHEEYIKLPPGFPRSEKILECARACTSPEFRGSDLWVTLMQHIAIVALQAKRDWVLISTTPELVRMYTRLGFRETGLTYEHELYPGKTQVVLLINAPEAVMGVGVGPIYWNVIWRGVSKYLGDQGLLKANTKVKLYSLMAPLAEWMRYRARRPRRTQLPRVGAGEKAASQQPQSGALG